MTRNRARAAKAAKPTAPTPVVPKPIPATGRMLLAQLDQSYLAQRRELLSIIAGELGFAPNAPITYDPQAGTIAVAPATPPE